MAEDNRGFRHGGKICGPAAINAWAEYFLRLQDTV
jgi:hypothetical protein